MPRCALIIAILFLCSMTSGLFGQQAVPSDAVTLPEVEARIAQLETSEFDEATRTTLRALYEDAKRSLEAAAASRERAAAFRREAEDAPRLLETIQQELASPQAAPKPEVPADATRAQLEQTLQEVGARLKASRDRVNELKTESVRRRERRTEIPTQMADLTARLDDVLTAPTANVTESGVAVQPEIVDARRIARDAQVLAIQEEIESLRAEVANYDARRDLLPARIDRANRRVAEQDTLQSAWQEIVTRRRGEEAAEDLKAAEALRREAARQHPVLQEFAAASRAIAERRASEDSVLARTSTAERLTSDARDRLTRLRGRYTEARRRIEATGLNRATGRHLRRQYEALPELVNVRAWDDELSDLQREMVDAQDTLFDLRDEREEAGDVDSVARRLVDAVRAADPEGVTPEIEAAARDLAAARRTLLDSQINDVQKYTEETLLSLDTAIRQLLDAARVYDRYIRERIFWVRSIDRVPSGEEFRSAGAWLFDAKSWSDGFQRLTRHVGNRLASAFVWTALLMLLIAANVWSRKEIARRGELVRRFQTDKFRHTLIAFALTVLAPLPIPVFFWMIGSAITAAPRQPDVVMNLGEGLRHAALGLYGLLTFRLVFRRGGLADAHFRWRVAALQPLRRNLRWLIPVLTIAIILVHLLDPRSDDPGKAVLGVAAFTVGMLALTIYIQRVLRPGGTVFAEFQRRNENGWLVRTRYIWLPLLIGLPMFIAALAWAGFYYTAQQLDARLEMTLAYIVLLVTINGVLMRWLFIARRRIAVEDATRRREQALQDAKRAAEAGVDVIEPEAPPINEDEVDLPSVSAQTRQIFRAVIFVALLLGSIGIWSDVLPALNMLDRVEVYPTPRVVETLTYGADPVLDAGTESTAASSSSAPAAEAATGNPVAGMLPGDGDAAAPAPEAETVVSLADIGLGIIVLVLTLITFRNFPGLVDMALLQNLPLDVGSRYALSTVLRYAIAIIGVMIAFSVIGISWNRVQWLAAALTFGLAFGLQEIFANFVSGLIILAERPVRIGDTVTVGPVSGIVSRIRMRATTITDFDRKELVIPNKTFITDQVINWSLTDPTLRLIIPVGVGYGEDVRLTEKVLLELAQGHPMVLQDPKPNVQFMQFGDSTLNFELRVFITGIEQLVPVRHDLHMRITEAFREHDIEIAFPQRDLHIRSTGDLRDIVQMQKDSDANESA